MHSDMHSASAVCSAGSLEPPHAGQAQFKIHTPKDFMVVGLSVNWKILRVFRDKLVK